VKDNNQAKAHADNKHGKSFADCFPGFE